MIKSKTAQGFIGNFAAAGQKSLDRTEPMIGAKVVLELYRKYGDKWIVDLLLNDLIDWHDWFATYRILAPAGLICLGSNPVPGDSYWAPNTLNSAKLESGLDNSPMWDGSAFNATSHQMQLYELSQSSFYVAEASHLIELAAAVGRSEETAHLEVTSTIIAGDLGCILPRVPAIIVRTGAAHLNEEAHHREHVGRRPAGLCQQVRFCLDRFVAIHRAVVC